MVAADVAVKRPAKRPDSGVPDVTAGAKDDRRGQPSSSGLTGAQYDRSDDVPAVSSVAGAACAAGRGDKPVVPSTAQADADGREAKSKKPLRSPSQPPDRACRLRADQGSKRGAGAAVDAARSGEETPRRMFAGSIVLVLSMWLLVVFRQHKTPVRTRASLRPARLLSPFGMKTLLPPTLRRTLLKCPMFHSYSRLICSCLRMTPATGAAGAQQVVGFDIGQL